MADTTFLYNGANRVTYGSDLYGYGPPDDLVVSLGDRGTALLGFDIPIRDLPGPDFAVFENSFGDAFLELAFVEVSSDGSRFIRFPAVSLVQTEFQVNTFDTTDATQINNFAGKYRLGYGTPFDLSDLKDSTGIDLSDIRWVRIIDVGGCIQPLFASLDSRGHKVNDPWPTPFDTGGFDLDAVGVIHDIVDHSYNDVALYPVPVVNTLNVSSYAKGTVQMDVLDATGRVVMQRTLEGQVAFDFTVIRSGVYLARFTFADGSRIMKKFVKR